MLTVIKRLLTVINWEINRNDFLSVLKLKIPQFKGVQSILSTTRHGYSRGIGLPTLDLGIPGTPPPFPSLPSLPSPPSFPFPVGPTPKPAMGSRKRCRLTQWGLGQSPSRQLNDLVHISVAKRSSSSGNSFCAFS